MIRYVDAEADKEATVGQRLAPVCRVLQGKHHGGFVHDALDLRHHAQATLNPQFATQRNRRRASPELGRVNVLRKIDRAAGAQQQGAYRCGLDLK
jgi:hypothetical protein